MMYWKYAMHVRKDDVDVVHTIYWSFCKDWAKDQRIVNCVSELERQYGRVEVRSLGMVGLA